MMMRLGRFLALVSVASDLVVSQIVVDEDATDLNVPVTRCLSADEFEPTTDYFENSKFVPRDYVPDFVTAVDAEDGMEEFQADTTTDLFSISYHNHYKIVTNHWANNQTYLLYLCGTEQEIPVEEKSKHHLVLSVPHTGGVAVTQTTQIPFLELLGVRREMIAYIGDPQYVSSPCMNYMMDQENSIDVIFNENDPWNTTINAALRAQFLEDHPDAIILDGPYGDPDGDRVVIAAATQERTTVATFDWIGYYAAFFNLEGLSNEIAAETKARYDCSSSNAAQLSAAATKKPVVLWATYFTGYNWSVAECPTWDYSYYCEYAMHCGANIISRPEGFGYNDPSFGGNYWYVDDEQLLELGKNADYFVYPIDTWETVYAEKKDILDQIKAVQNKQVYDNQGQGPTAWHEQRLAEYDVVALDFCEMVGNTDDEAAVHERKWLRNVYTEPIGSLSECNVDGGEIDQPYVAKGAECTPMDGSDATALKSGAPESSFVAGLAAMALANAIALAGLM